MISGELRRAYKLFVSRKFTEVIRLLEPQVFRYRENFSFYYLLGISCLYIGDFGGALSYLQRADQLKHNNNNVLYGLAVVYLKRNDFEKALKLWLKILDKNPNDRIARSGIDLARKIIADREKYNPENIKNLKRLYPQLPVRRGRIIFFSIMGLIIISGLVLSFETDLFGNLGRFIAGYGRGGLNERNFVNDITLEKGTSFIDYNASIGEKKLTKREIEDIFSKAKKYLLKYRDNLAIVEINRLLQSNASAYVKEKAKLLKTFVNKPDFTTLKDSFDYSVVAMNPSLYVDCYVSWRGKIANVKEGDKTISFDLLVGYESEKELKGVVPVKLDFPANIENGDSLEVLGKIVLSGKIIMLEGVSIHKLLK